MKIAIISTGIFPLQIGGIQKHTFYLSKYLARKKVSVDLFISLDDNQKIAMIYKHFSTEELKYLCFIKISFPKTIKFPGHYIFSSWLFSKRIFNNLDINKYEGVYAQGFTSWFFLKKNPFSNKIISNLHGLNMFQPTMNLKNQTGLFLLRIPAKTIIQKSKHQISLGGKLSNLLLKNGANNSQIVTIPNGISPTWLTLKDMARPKKNPLRIKFTYIGRYERLKGIEELYLAIKKTIDGNSYELNFIGPIPKNKQIKHSNITYIGAIYDESRIKEELIETDVLVCPSYSEGMPTVILEAMACGCAIIATDVGAVNELVDNHNGILVEPGNIDQLEKAIISFTQMDKNNLQKMKVHSIEKVKTRFTWDVVADQTIELIKTL